MKHLFLLLLLCPLFISCSSDNDEDLTTKTYEKRRADQDEHYNNIASVIVGHWVLAQTYNKTIGKWNSVTDVWSEFTFNSDNTYTRIENGSTSTGTYSLVKNEDYVLYGTRGDVNIVFNGTIVGIEGSKDTTSYYVWIDSEGYMRFDRVGTLGVASDSGLRYVKE